MDNGDTAFYRNRVIIRFVVVGNGGVVRVWRDIRRGVPAIRVVKLYLI